jgi:hypothetical protein
MAGRPLADDDPRRCKAKSKQTGNQCRKTAIPGGTVCRAHCGKAPQVIEAAEKRIQRLVHPALGALELAITDPDQKVRKDAVAAARDILDRAGYGATKKVEVENVSKDEFESDLKAYLLGRHDAYKEQQTEAES